MAVYDLSPEARADFREIYLHIVEQNQELTIADGFTRKLRERIELLGHFPMSGISCADMRKEKSRRVIYQSYTIYYRPLRDGIYVTRIVNSRMNQRKIRGV